MGVPVYFLETIEQWLLSLVNYGYIGIFLLSFIGAGSIIIPIPYTVVLLSLSMTRIFDPTLLAIASGIGSAAGEMVGYGLGYISGKAVLQRYEKKMNAISSVFNRYGSVVVFIFALTPLPDDLLFIPLGILHFSFWKVIIPALAGKLLMCFIIVYVGAALGQFYIGGGGGLVETVALTILLVLIIIAIFKIDWETVINKYIPDDKKDEKR